MSEPVYVTTAVFLKMLYFLLYVDDSSVQDLMFVLFCDWEQKFEPNQISDANWRIDWWRKLGPKFITSTKIKSVIHLESELEAQYSKRRRGDSHIQLGSINMYKKMFIGIGQHRLKEQIGVTILNKYQNEASDSSGQRIGSRVL